MRRVLDRHVALSLTEVVLTELLPTIEELRDERVRWQQEHAQIPFQRSDGAMDEPYSWEPTRRPLDPYDQLNPLAAEFCMKAAMLGIRPSERAIAGESFQGYSMGCVVTHSPGERAGRDLVVDAEAGQVLRERGYGPTYEDGCDSPTTLDPPSWPLEDATLAELTSKLVERMSLYLRTSHRVVFTPIVFPMGRFE